MQQEIHIFSSETSMLWKYIKVLPVVYTHVPPWTDEWHFRILNKSGFFQEDLINIGKKQKEFVIFSSILHRKQPFFFHNKVLRKAQDVKYCHQYLVT